MELPLVMNEAAYVELWFIGYVLKIKNDVRCWYHHASNKRIRDENVIVKLEHELEEQRKCK